MKHLRDKLSYANVVATLALFVALGGSSYAAITIGGKNIRNGSITGKDIKRNTLGPRQVKESRLDTIRHAANATKLGGVTADQLVLQCPGDMLPVTNACVERTPRPPVPYGFASNACSSAGAQRPARVIGRRLPTYDELQSALSYQEITMAPGGEFTSAVVAQGSQLQVTLMTGKAGSVAQVPDSAEAPHGYRCASDPLN